MFGKKSLDDQLTAPISGHGATAHSASVANASQVQKTPVVHSDIANDAVQPAGCFSFMRMFFNSKKKPVKESQENKIHGDDHVTYYRIRE